MLSCETIAGLGPDASAASSASFARYGRGPARDGGSDAALSGLAGSALADRFRSWRGASGRRYVFSVFRQSAVGPAGSCPDFANAVVIAAARDHEGTRRIVSIAETESYPDLFFKGSALAEARAAGATELHVHLLAATRVERRAIIADLCQRG